MVDPLSSSTAVGLMWTRTDNAIFLEYILTIELISASIASTGPLGLVVIALAEFFGVTGSELVFQILLSGRPHSFPDPPLQRDHLGLVSDVGIRGSKCSLHKMQRNPWLTFSSATQCNGLFFGQKRC